jgi:hypothetical protein
MLVDFGYGQVSDIKTRAQGTEGEVNDADYPYLFLNPTQHVRTQQQITYNFNMIVMDMAREEEAHEYQNFLNIQSDCIQYIDDVVARLYYFYKDKPEVSMDLNYTPFYERFQDDLAGATATLSIVVPNSINECIAPFTPVPTPPATCLPSLTIFNDSQNEFQYTRDPDDTTRIWRWEDNTQENLAIGNFADQYFSNALTGDFEFYLTQLVTFIEPAAGEVLPQRPILSSLQASYPDVEPTCDSGNWPTVWSADPITYIAKYNVSLSTLTSFGVLGFEDPAANESAIVQEIGGTLSIGFDGVIPDPTPIIYQISDTEVPGIFTQITSGTGPSIGVDATIIDTDYLTEAGTDLDVNLLQDGTYRFTYTTTSANLIDQSTIDTAIAANPSVWSDPTGKMYLQSGWFFGETLVLWNSKDLPFTETIGDDYTLTHTFDIALPAGRYKFNFLGQPYVTAVDVVAQWSSISYQIELLNEDPYVAPVGTLVLDVDTSTNQIFRPDTSGSPLSMNGTVTLDTYNAIRVGTPNYYNITQNGTWQFTVTGTAYRTTNNATPFTTGLNMAVKPNSGSELTYEANPQTWPANPAVNVDFDFELTWDAYELNGANIQYIAFNTPNEPAVEDEFYIKAGAVVKGYFTPA